MALLQEGGGQIKSFYPSGLSVKYVNFRQGGGRPPPLLLILCQVQLVHTMSSYTRHTCQPGALKLFQIQGFFVQRLLKKLKELSNKRFIIDIIYLFIKIHFLKCFLYEMNHKLINSMNMSKNVTAEKKRLRQIGKCGKGRGVCNQLICKIALNNLKLQRYGHNTL